MARPKNSDLQKVTLNLRAGDLEKMGHLFPNAGGGGPAIRILISTFVDKQYSTQPKEASE